MFIWFSGTEWDSPNLLKNENLSAKQKAPHMVQGGLTEGYSFFLKDQAQFWDKI